MNPFSEKYSSQLPALRLLINAGYTYLSHEKVKAYRNNSFDTVLLEPILKQQLSKINQVQVSTTQAEKYSESNIEEAVRKLRSPMAEGYILTTEKIYQMLILGSTLVQTIEGNKRSYTLKYIDWENPSNNVFHVVDEFSVNRKDGKKMLRPDIVLFVNGIPLCVIENKKENIKDPISEAISQHLRNQQEDNIRSLYIYAQILISCAVGQAQYATNGTPHKFWSMWHETEIRPDQIQAIKNKALPESTINKILSNTQNPEEASQYFTEAFTLTEQDQLLYAVANPERLLDLIHNYIVYDKGIKKIARYNQYFAVKKTLQQVKGEHNDPREGGVIWHSTGSGKSIAMALMAEAIAREKTILNPKLILVTDRTSLDKQITKTFENAGLDVFNATTGSKLIELLENNTDAVITTIVNKFETAVKNIKKPLESNNIFVLIDEAHRTQYGTFNVSMQQALPNACFLAFTGTPLFKKNKDTQHKFGKIIDKYTNRQAVRDGAVRPIVYEGRHSIQEVNKREIDKKFDRVTEPLTPYESADLKNKYARQSHLQDSDPNIEEIAYDIAQHFKQNFRGTALKGQVVCSSKKVAIKYLERLKENGITCELVISAPDQRKDEDSAYQSSGDPVAKFWKAMMDQYGTAKNYEDSIIRSYKEEDTPELIIVVDKLLTGFDAPRNTVLYLTRKLRDHTLMQAISRVNRQHEDKEYGYIIDYAGVIAELNDTLKMYCDSDDDYALEDVQGVAINIMDEIEKLDPAHQHLLDIFKTLSNRKDIEAFQQLLRPQDVRDSFYKRLRTYANMLKLALSSVDFVRQTSEEQIEIYKEDLKYFMKLRALVVNRYSDGVNYKDFEGQIQKLIDTHITSTDVIQLTKMVNIYDEEAFEEEVENTTGKKAKADKIASRTKKHINESMEEDPAFYKKFSKLIQDTIDDFYSERISEIEYLQKIQQYKDRVLSRTDEDIPEAIRANKLASAFFGILHAFYKAKEVDTKPHEMLLADAVLQIEAIIEHHKVVNWERNTDVIKKIKLALGDYIYDEVNKSIGADIKFSEVDPLVDKIIEVALVRSKK